MSTFDNKSLKKNTLKFKTTHKCSASKTFSSNSYLTSPSIHNETTSDNFINTKYEVDLPSIYNEWKYYTIKYGEEYLNIQHNRSTNQTLTQHE